MHFRLLILLLSLSTLANAQLNNQMFRMGHEQVLLKPGKISFGLYSLGFARNTEYANLLKEGRTYMGYQFLPSVNYRADSFFSLQFGVYLRNDFGGSFPQALEPVFQMKYQKGMHQFIIGTLQGNLSHELIEPLYDFENVLNDPIENGIQYLIDHRILKADVWVDWRKMIYPASPFQEVFTAGMHTKLTLLNKPNWQLVLPVQMMAQHKGGEIDASPDPVQSIYNTAIGGQIKYRPLKSKLQNIDLQVYGTYYLDESRFVVDSFIDGNGTYASLNFKWKYLNLMMNYWDSYQFQSTLGDPVFHSVSDESPDRLFFIRNVAMARLGYERPLSAHLSFMGRVQYIHDLKEGQGDVITELYLRYRHVFHGKGNN
jgi:hypothetical protein